MLLDQRTPSVWFNWHVHILVWIVATSGEELSVSGTRCFLCTSDWRDMHTVHNRWLKTGEYVCPVFDVVDIFCELPDLQTCRVHKLCPESFRNREFVQNFCKLQIHRHGGVRGRRWENKNTSNTKCKVWTSWKRTRTKCVQDGATWQTQNGHHKPCHNPRNLPKVWHAHTHRHGENTFSDRDQMKYQLGNHDTVEELDSLVPRSTTRSQGVILTVMFCHNQHHLWER